MPLYEIQNEKTGERTEVILSYAALQEYLSENPDWKQSICAPKVAPDPIQWGFQKAPEAWRKKLNTMKKAHAGSTINDLGG